jgi:Na+/H+-dicarboxylate symporter
MFEIKNPRLKKFLGGGSLLTILTVIGVAIGVGLGLGLRGTKDEKWSSRDVMYLKLIGDLFLRALGALILPLIVSSLIDAVGSLDLSLSKKIGTRALLYYLATTGIAAILGLILGVTVQPGNRSEFVPGDECVSQNTSTVDTILDLIRNAFPPNLVGATLELVMTS